MARLNPNLSLVVLFVFSLFLTACQAVMHEKGSILEPQEVARIKVGVSTRAEVKEILGIPTFINTFRNHRWSYVQDRQFKNLQRTFSRVINRVEITFDERGVVKEIQHNFGESLLDPESLPHAQNNQTWLGWLWGGEYMRPAIESQPTKKIPDHYTAQPAE